MKIPAEHLSYLRKPFKPKYRFPFTGYSFTNDEVQALTKYGHWLMALDRGWIHAFTPHQEHFVACCRGATEPASAYERLWLRYTNSVANELSEENGARRRMERLKLSLSDLEREELPTHPDDHKWHVRAIEEIEREMKDLEQQLDPTKYWAPPVPRAHER